ncbi:MAG: amidohydrolase [Dehalococcoidia bacterium]|nr:amidohydrolase [Dehalococcoidia bacterium]
MKAIDVHVHPPRQPGLAPDISFQHVGRYFRLKQLPTNVQEMAALYKEQDIVGVIFSIDSETVSGDKPDSNDYLADIVKAHPQQFMGFACIDPWKGKRAVDELERSVTKLGLRGVKFHPIVQTFDPSDRQFYPLYQMASDLGVPVLFHTGFAAHGAGEPGGLGAKLKYARPILLDDVAADFPKLTIIMAHPAWPWMEEQIAIALHKANIYIDLSGWSPRYIPEQLIREAGSRLQDKVLFGSDYPFITPERWLKDFENIPIKEDARPKILLENARRVLKIP